MWRRPASQSEPPAALLVTSSPLAYGESAAARQSPDCQCACIVLSGTACVLHLSCLPRTLLQVRPVCQLRAVHHVRRRAEPAGLPFRHLRL